MQAIPTNFVYRRPNRTPIQLSWVGTTLMVDCCLRFNRRALASGPADSPEQTYAGLILAGIEQAWNGTYDLGTAGMPEPVTVAVRFQPDTVRKAAAVRVHRLLVMPAHVISPLYRRIWGILRTGQLESMGLNWTPRNPGAIVMPPYEQARLVRDVAAHEFGHLLGIGDAYGALYRFYSAAPGTGRYMMHSNGQVQPEEIRMLIQAHRRGRMQFFPRRWQARVFWEGLRREFRQLIKRCRQ
ncbi:MAG: hypothetical protein GX112_13930 [Clostridiaceae bacterium]|jgi:hypothetical protein|nr:hypothetical protein [Clostridiaceae bacterium]